MKKEVNFEDIAPAIKAFQQNYNPKISFKKNVESTSFEITEFQELFKKWANISAEKFFKHLNSITFKNTSSGKHPNLFSSISKKDFSDKKIVFHDFINLHSLTSEEYKNAEKNLLINYSFSSGIFGNILLASTAKGICYLAFYENQEKAINTLIENFPHADFQEKTDNFQQNALLFFQEDWKNLKKIDLHIKGTAFQFKVWKELLKIPVGELSTYGKIAKEIQNPKAFRAVGTAIGSNAVAYLIPCH